jgi:hypothetical protein
VKRFETELCSLAPSSVVRPFFADAEGAAGGERFLLDLQVGLDIGFGLDLGRSRLWEATTFSFSLAPTEVR